VTAAHATGAWISAESAVLVSWSETRTLEHTVSSAVPGRHRSTGRAPTESHPGAEGHRDEHMRAFFAEVAAVLPAEDDVLLIGDGEVVEHFAEQIRAEDRSHGRSRRVEIEKHGRVTGRQLLARTREFAGAPPRRQLPR